MYFPDRGCVRTLYTLYVYATARTVRRTTAIGVRRLLIGSERVRTPLASFLTFLG